MDSFSRRGPSKVPLPALIAIQWRNEFSVTPALQVSLLGAAPTKAAALSAPLLLAVATLLVTGTFGLTLAFGSWGTGAAIVVERSGCLAEVEARDQAVVELQVTFVLPLRLYSAHRCATGTYGSNQKG